MQRTYAHFCAFDLCLPALLASADLIFLLTKDTYCTLKYARACVHVQIISPPLQVVCVGGGYIGLEAAAGLSLHDLDITMVFPEQHLCVCLVYPCTVCSTNVCLNRAHPALRSQPPPLPPGIHAPPGSATSCHQPPCVCVLHTCTHV